MRLPGESPSCSERLKPSRHFSRGRGHVAKAGSQIATMAQSHCHLALVFRMPSINSITAPACGPEAFRQFFGLRVFRTNLAEKEKPHKALGTKMTQRKDTENMLKQILPCIRFELLINGFIGFIRKPLSRALNFPGSPRTNHQSFKISLRLRSPAKFQGSTVHETLYFSERTTVKP